MIRNGFRRARYFVAAAGVSALPGLGSLTLTGFAPTVTVSNNQSVTPGLGSLTITGFAPTVVVNSAVNPGKGDLVLTGFAPTVATPIAVVPGMGAITLTGFAPSVVVDSPVKPGVGQLVITGFAPTVATPVAVLPDKGDLVLTGFAPSVAVGTNVSPGTGALSLDGFAPTVVATANQNITVDVGQITITGFAPTVEVSGSATPPTIPDVRIGAGGGDGGGFELFAAMRAGEARRTSDGRQVDSLVAPAAPLIVVPPVVVRPRSVESVAPVELAPRPELRAGSTEAIDLGPSLIPAFETPIVVEFEPFTDAALDGLRARTQAAHDRQSALVQSRAEMFAPRASTEPMRPTSPVAHAALLAEAQRQVVADEELAWVLLIAS